MATKTFKIGEYAKGGIITVNTYGKTIQIIGKDWDHSKGTRRSSDQSKAKQFTETKINADDNQCRRKLEIFLTDLTTSYYAGQIIKWIETKVKLQTSLYW